MSDNVLPRATACHATDCGNRNAQVSGYHQKGIALTPASSNLPDAGLGQLGVMDPLSASRFRGQGRSGVTSTLAARSFYHKMLSNYAGKAA